MELVFIFWLFGVLWLSVWAIKVNRDPEKHRKKGPFGMRDSEEIGEVYGKRMPY
jgi:hypothetical protein